MSDFVVSPRFERPPPVGGWFKSALGSALWEAPLYVAILAASLNCSYAPPARAALDQRTHLTASDQGWLQVPDKFFNAPLGVPSNDARRNASYVVDRRSVLEPRTHITRPNDGWLSALPLFNAPTDVGPADGRRNDSFIIPARAQLDLRLHLLEPDDGWWQKPLALWNAPFNVGMDDATRNSYQPPARTVLDVRRHLTDPNDGWLHTPAKLFDAPDGVASKDVSRNSYLPPQRAVLDPRIHLLDPNDGWITASLVPAFAANLYPAIGGAQQIASYRPSNLSMVAVGRTTPGGTGGTNQGGAPWDSSLTVGPADLVSYLPPAQAKVLLGIHDTSPVFSWFEAEALWDNIAVDDGIRNSYVVPSGAKLVLGTHDTAPSTAWIFSVLPVTAPVYPSGVETARNSYSPPSRATLRLGIHDTAPNRGWLTALPLWNAPTSVGIDDAGRNSYRVIARAALDVRGTSPNYTPLPIPPPLYPVGTETARNSYLVWARARAFAADVPAQAWIFKALPVLSPPTYPPGSYVAWNSYVQQSGAIFRPGIHDITVEPAWIEYAATHVVPPPPPPVGPPERKVPRLKPTLQGAPIPGIVRHGSPVPWLMQKYWKS